LKQSNRILNQQCLIQEIEKNTGYHRHLCARYYRYPKQIEHHIFKLSFRNFIYPYTYRRQPACQ